MASSLLKGIDLSVRYCLLFCVMRDPEQHQIVRAFFCTYTSWKKGRWMPDNSLLNVVLLKLRSAHLMKFFSVLQKG